MMFLRITGSPLRGVRILKVGPGVIQTATIMGRKTRGGPLSLPKPFPYLEKRIPFYYRPLDNTMLRVCQENAKIIVVEGPIGVGKSAFAKALAEEFDMFYMPQPTMDQIYVLPSGYDLRQHDKDVPEEVRTFDHKNFCQCPKDKKAGRFQMRMIQLKFFQYLDAVCHIFNTGQGVVMERSVYSDYVFMKAMHEQKYVNKEVLDMHETVTLNTSPVFMPPHLIIYLDIPVPVVQERIRTRNYCYEQNSPALTKEYLSSLEKFWKQDYLKQARERSDILIYDWSDGGDIDVVVDDIEKIDFDIMRSDGKFVRWWLARSKLFRMRREMTNTPERFARYVQYPSHRVEDLFVPFETYKAWNEILSSLPEGRYDIGYNYLMGDSIFNILMQWKVIQPRTRRYYMNYQVFT